jgi:RHS repeat-associated protein
LTEYDDSTLDYTYDDAGNVLTMNDYHGNSITYTYTDRNQVSTISAPLSRVWTYNYNDLGQRTSVTLGNGMTSNYEYDERNRLTKIDHKNGDTTARSYTYDLDDVGNITQDTEQSGANWDYWYDGRYRLTKAEWRSGGLKNRYTYTYDDGDNMLSKLVYDAVASTTDTYVYEHNDANELTKQTLNVSTDTLFYYDDWGRMISKDQGDYAANYEYRYGDKLKSVTSNFPDEADVTYEYGSDGKRRSRDTSSSYTWYNWDAGWNVINEESSGNTLERTYVHDPGKAVGSILAHADGASFANRRYYLEDILGSTRGLYYDNKGYAGGTRYAPYGAVQNQTGSWNTSYMFTGKDWDDDAQMYYFPFRYYSPGIGRWTTRDPIGIAGGLNLYGYVLANPTSLVDPLGLDLLDLVNRLWCEGRWPLSPHKPPGARIPPWWGSAVTFTGVVVTAVGGTGTVATGGNPIGVGITIVGGFITGLGAMIETWNLRDTGLAAAGPMLPHYRRIFRWLPPCRPRPDPDPCP